MIYTGNRLVARYLHHDRYKGIVEVNFNSDKAINVFDMATLDEFSELLALLEQLESLDAVVLTSDKNHFVMGGDITHFPTVISQGEHALREWISRHAKLFDRFEDLPVPTLAAVNGFALGGGLELALTCDYRLLTDNAKVGLPESQLGIIPGYGGTVRLPRLIGADKAIEMMILAKHVTAVDALKMGLADGVVAAEHLQRAGIDTLVDALDGQLDWRAKRLPKLLALQLSVTERSMLFEVQRDRHGRSSRHYPAIETIISCVEKSAEFGRETANKIESAAFASIGGTDSAIAQIGVYLADRKVQKIAKSWASSAKPKHQAAVLGAGIMGGGIAYVTAVKGVPVRLKDIFQQSLDLGIDTVRKWLKKDVQSNRMTLEQLMAVSDSIQPTLHNDDLTECDFVIEAVVENPDIKAKVLSEIEKVVSKEAVITSNTSTISITQLAKNMTHPERFCGMHYFNPVPRMPLVEVIRGEKTSEQTIADTVAFALKQGKIPLVVNDCPGFYVNRVLFPYLAGFSQLVKEGVDFVRIDNVMEQTFGWPMGPAWLSDVIGIDTLDHCTSVMAIGFPTRMAKIESDPITILYQQQRLGQKSGAGFYNFSKDKRGKSVKVAADSYELFPSLVNNEISNEEIVYRLMVPMINEVLRCLDEGIIGSPEEADMGLIYALGFPRFRGGPLRYLDSLGLTNFVAQADKYQHLGEIYQVPDRLRQKMLNQQTIYA
ncbi:MAG: 3-hydroxyacyl-CoA dehydrogenase/enoyl-CoA hydratase/3-hydroxybutyryl-CoA epimerase [Shewanella sp.]|jgi:3-hydroxyacyl-CoA dehydrogenase/enoyl-CoA hydratase/3-hydroxybutyryl-CoA epimerase/enoyl-CoA isomerase